MSVREEERNKNCPSRGLGIAAAAIGVGVGAALYYFFSKRQENPADEGATSSGWSSEQPHTLHNTSSESYTTISEHSTSDTSINSDSSVESNGLRTKNLNILQTISRRLWNDSTSDSSIVTEYSITSDDEIDDVTVDYTTADEVTVDDITADEVTADDITTDDVTVDDMDEPIGSDSDTNMEWDVTTSSLDVPRAEPRSRSPIMMQFGELTVSLLNPHSGGWKHNTSSESYTTISEHSTSDTSINSDSSVESNWLRNKNLNILQTISRRLLYDSTSDSSIVTEYSITSDDEIDDVTVDYTTADEVTVDDITADEVTADDITANDVTVDDIDEPIGSDSDTNMEWDVTTSSLDVPRAEPRSRSPIMMQFGELTVSLLNPHSGGWNRERSWSLEECSICFEVMLKDEELLSLNCTHRFHQACVLPWLQEQQTCPNCRKAS